MLFIRVENHTSASRVWGVINSEWHCKPPCACAGTIRWRALLDRTPARVFFMFRKCVQIYTILHMFTRGRGVNGADLSAVEATKKSWCFGVEGPLGHFPLHLPQIGVGVLA